MEQILHFSWYVHAINLLFSTFNCVVILSLFQISIDNAIDQDMHQFMDYIIMIHESLAREQFSYQKATKYVIFQNCSKGWPDAQFQCGGSINEGLPVLIKGLHLVRCNIRSQLHRSFPVVGTAESTIGPGAKLKGMEGRRRWQKDAAPFGALLRG